MIEIIYPTIQGIAEELGISEDNSNEWTKSAEFPRRVGETYKNPGENLFQNRSLIIGQM